MLGEVSLCLYVNSVQLTMFCICIFSGKYTYSISMCLLMNIYLCLFKICYFLSDFSNKHVAIVNHTQLPIQLHTLLNILFFSDKHVCVSLITKPYISISPFTILRSNFLLQ